MTPGSLSAWPWPYLAPVLLLAGSNLFMTLAWYGHL
ncbi:MAG: DMT family protein, partial [Methyloceanibacter sp.]